MIKKNKNDQECIHTLKCLALFTSLECNIKIFLYVLYKCYITSNNDSDGDRFLLLVCCHNED